MKVDSSNLTYLSAYPATSAWSPKAPNACARFDNPLFLDVLDRYTYGRRVTAKLNNADYQICSGPATDQFYGCNSFAVRSWLDLEEGQPKLTTSAGAEYQMFCVESLFNGVQEDWGFGNLYRSPE